MQMKELFSPYSNTERREMRPYSCASTTYSCEVSEKSAIGAGEESGKTLEVLRQVAFMRKSDRVRNGCEGPVRCGEEQFGSLNPTPNDILMRSKAG